MGASRAGGRGGPCTSSKALLFFSPLAPKKTQLSRKPNFFTWLLPSSSKCAHILLFILKEGKKVLVWCQVGVLSSFRCWQQHLQLPRAAGFWGAGCYSWGQTHFVAGSS